MVNRCVAAGFSNTPMLKLPSDGVLRRIIIGKASTADSSSVESYQTLVSLYIVTCHWNFVPRIYGPICTILIIPLKYYARSQLNLRGLTLGL